MLDPAGGPAFHTWRRRDLLSRLQTSVGGNVEAVALGPDLTLWLNEEGRFTLPANLPATVVAAELTAGTTAIATAGTAAGTAAADAHGYGPYGVLHGVAVLTGGTDEEGETLGLTAEAAALVCRLCPDRGPEPSTDPR